MTAEDSSPSSTHQEAEPVRSRENSNGSFYIGNNHYFTLVAKAAF